VKATRLMSGAQLGYSGTFGGPIQKNRYWFFGNYEYSETTGAQRQTNADTARGFQNENFTQKTTSPWPTFRITAQLAPSHNVWVKYSKNPTDGFIVDYWGNSAELSALTEQNQGGDNLSANYTGVLGAKWTASLMVARSTSFIEVVPFSTANTIENGAPFLDLNDGRFYNGATFDGRVDRPRNQVSGAMEYFANWMGKSHQIKFGVDWQDMDSKNQFRYPSNRIFYVVGFNPQTRAYCPGFTSAANCATRDSYEEYEDAPSTSTGKQTAFYIRDKFQIGTRANVEAGVRLEKQTGKSDVGVSTVDATTVSPRISASYSVTNDNKTIVLGSYGRFYDAILQGFSDAFGAVPQQTNYTPYSWNGTAYVAGPPFKEGASDFHPDTNVTPRHLDEVTFGVQRQLSNVMGVSARYIWRSWGNFIDDVRTFDSAGEPVRVVTNLDTAERTYKGLEFTVDKRFSRNWAATGSYTWSQTRGNHFGDDFTTLGDFLDAQCRTTVDPTIGTNGVVPCRTAAEGNRLGNPGNDRPHNIKFNGAYSVGIGRANLIIGGLGSLISKTTFTKNRTLNVLLPGTLTNAGPQIGYNYEPLGAERLPGMLFNLDGNVELTFKTLSRAQIGVRAEFFNVTNVQEKSGINSSVWCGDTSATAQAACTIARPGTPGFRTCGRGRSARRRPGGARSG